MLEVLAKDKHKDVREVVSLNRNTPIEVWEVLAEEDFDEDESE